MIQKQPKPLSDLNGDIKLTPLQSIEYEFFKSDRFPDQGNQAESLEQRLDKGSRAFKNRQIIGERFLCHHDCLDGISADEIRISLANHTIAYVRSLLCSISQITYHLCRQTIAGITSVAQLSGLMVKGLLPIMDCVRYSCTWAQRQMEKWWKDSMSPTTFRRIRAELEDWGCFVTDKVAPGSTRQVTPLREVNLPRLLAIAAMAFQRLSDEPDGKDRFIPSHNCGFLASLWQIFFKGTFYAPDDLIPDRHPETQLAHKRSELLRVQSLAQEHAWSDFLVTHYREQETAIKRQIANLEAFLSAGEVDIEGSCWEG